MVNGANFGRIEVTKGETMTHLIFGMNSISFITGVMVLGMLSLLRMKFKEKSIERYMYLHLNVLLLVMNFVYKSYIPLNDFGIGHIETGITRMIELGLFFTIPYFIQSLVKDQNLKYRWFFSILGITWTVMKYAIDFAMAQNIIYTQYYYLLISYLDFVLLMPIVYFIYKAIQIGKNMDERIEIKKIATQMVVIIIAFMPGIIADLGWFQLKIIAAVLPSGFYFTSLFFIVLNSLIIMTGVKYMIQPIHSTVYFRNQCNKYNLTEREEDIASLLLNGLSNSAISSQLFIELSTVKKHLQNIYKKTNTSQRFELIQKFRGIEV